MGWQQIYDTTDESYRLRWVQTVRGINWNTFREGEQMVCHIPNCGLFTNKLNLLCTLQSFEKQQSKQSNPQFIPLKDYLPTTYKLDDRIDRETFFATAKSNGSFLFLLANFKLSKSFLGYLDDEIWICKPVSLNQGRGIYLVRDPEMLRKKLEQNQNISKPIGRIIQKYIERPLLINKRKFDIRNYMIIASTKPLLCLFANGYLRLSINEFKNEDNSLTTHLTNQVLI
jgi:tubulin--tyrosine ligase like protein 10